MTNMQTLPGISFQYNKQQFKLSLDQWETQARRYTTKASKKACSEKRLLLPAVTNDNSYHSLLNAVINTIHSKSTFKKHVNISLPYWSWDTREHWFWLKLPCNWSSREKYSAWNVYSKLLRNQTIRFALSSNKLDSVQCCRHCQWQ